MCNGRILIVDDQPEIIQIINWQIEAIGDFEIDSAGKLIEALAKLAVNKYDVILLDLKMSNGHDPLEVVREVYAAAGDASIIVLTGAYPELGVKTLKAGARDFLIKAEYSQEDIANTIKVAMRRKYEREKFNGVQERFNELVNTVSEVEELVKGKK